MSRPSDAHRQKPVVIFGTGDIGQLAHAYLSHDSPYTIVAFCADGDLIREPKLLGLPVVPFESIETMFPPTGYAMFIALSYRKVNAVRAEKYHAAKAKGYELVSYVSTKSAVWDGTPIGDNCFIFEQQTIQPFVTIGNDVTVWSGNHIGHHCVIGDHVFIASHVCLAGHVTVEPYAFLGINSAIRDGVTIARGTVVGAGATIMKDTVAGGVYMGQHARRHSVDSACSPYFNPVGER